MKDYLAQFPVEPGYAMPTAELPKLLPPLRSLDIVSTPVRQVTLGRHQPRARRKKIPVDLAAYALVIALGLFGGALFLATAGSRAAAPDDTAASEPVWQDPR